MSGLGGTDIQSMARELVEAAERQLAAIDADSPSPTRDLDSTYERLATGLTQQGWFDLPAEDFLGGTGSPLLTTAFFALAGQHLAPGPLFESIVIAPTLRVVAPASRTALAPGRPLAWVDAAECSDGRRGAVEPRVAGDRLTGSVSPVWHLANAVQLVLLAATDGGPALIVLEAHRAGITRVPLSTMDPCSTAGRLTVDCHITDEDILVSGQTAVEIIRTVRALTRLAAAAELHGLCEHLVDMSVEYSKTRRQFGREIGSFQSIKHLLADMATGSIGLGNLIESTVEKLPMKPPELMIAAAMAKAFASETSVAIAQTALQVHGGIGFTEEHPLNRYFKRALVLENRFGGSAELYHEVGRSRLQTSARR